MQNSKIKNSHLKFKNFDNGITMSGIRNYGSVQLTNSTIESPYTGGYAFTPIDKNITVENSTINAYGLFNGDIGQYLVKIANSQLTELNKYNHIGVPKLFNVYDSNFDSFVY